MESVYTELSLNGSKNECAKSDTVFLPISEFCNGTVSLCSWLSNIRNIFFDRKSPKHLEVGFFGRGGPKTRIQTIFVELKRRKKIVSSQVNIMNTFFDQRSPRHPEVGVLFWHRQTHTYTDIATI